MRVQSARTKDARRIEFLFQRLLNALLHRVKRCEDGRGQAHSRTGLLRPTEHRGLSTHGCNCVPNIRCLAERRPDPTLSTMPLYQSATGRDGQVYDWRSLGNRQSPQNQVFRSGVFCEKWQTLISGQGPIMACCFGSLFYQFTL